MKWMSRHRVATWLGTEQKKRCRDTDLMSRHGVAWVGVATWSWRRDMGAGCLCGALFGHCSGHCWTLFMDTVHETLFTGFRKKKKKSIEFLKIFLWVI